MADEELLEPVEEMGGDEEDEEEGGGSPLMRYLPMILGVLVLQIIIGYGLVSWLFSPSEETEEADKQEMVAEQSDAQAGAGAEGAVSMQLDEVIYEQLDAIVVNPAGTEGLRFLSVSVHLGLVNPEVAVAIETKRKKSRIVDALYKILSSKTIAQLDPERHEDLKKEMMVSLNSFLGKNAVINVYFQGFVLK